LFYTKVGGRAKALTSRITSKNSKLLEGCSQIIWAYASTSGLLSLISGGRKNKRTDLDDRRLILCHAKVRRESISVSLAKMLGGHVSPVHPRFVITDFRW